MDDIVHELRLLINDGDEETILENRDDSSGWQNSTMHSFIIIDGILQDKKSRREISGYFHVHYNYSITPDNMIMGSFKVRVSKWGYESTIPFRYFLPVNMSVTSYEFYRHIKKEIEERIKSEKRRSIFYFISKAME